jgi:subfamily B ATP-binding cassette protein HlyB/CyaB
MSEQLDKRTPNQEETKVNKSSLLDSGVVCLHFLLSYHGVCSSPEQIYHDFSGAEGNFDLIALVRAARKNGLKSKAISINFKKLSKLPLPAIAELKNGTFIVVAKIAEDRVLVQRAESAPEELMNDYQRHCTENERNSRNCTILFAVVLIPACQSIAEEWLPM